MFQACCPTPRKAIEVLEKCKKVSGQAHWYSVALRDHDCSTDLCARMKKRSGQLETAWAQISTLIKRAKPVTQTREDFDAEKMFTPADVRSF